MSHTPLEPPTWKQRKFAGNGPATSSEKSTFSERFVFLVNATPPASWSAAVGLERSIVVYARRPSVVPIEHEFGPCGNHSESFGNRYWPCAQIPYWPPCCSVFTPDQLAHTFVAPFGAGLCVGLATNALFS